MTTTESVWRGRRLHFVGIGGTGMSGLALVCSRLGAVVSGSDRRHGQALERLRAAGITVSVEHAAENVPSSGELVYSSAVRADNVERARARTLGLRERRRGEVLAELTCLRRCIAVAGTHGKTTTSAMIVHGLRGAGIRAGYVIGAGLQDGLPSASWEDGEWLVVETDESDRTLLAVEPEIAVLTNIALEHINAYSSLDELREVFATFVAGAQKVVAPPGLLSDAGEPHAFALADLSLSRAGSTFRWRGRRVQLSVPGAHNALNATAALEACRLAGADPVRAVRSLASYPGAKRRLELAGRTTSGATVYEDYAIHANEIRATLAALRTLEPRRVVAVLEPLLYSRTHHMAADLGRALARADAVAVLDVFAGSELDGDHPRVSGEVVAREATKHANGRPVAWTPTAEGAREHLESLLGAGDACVIMGVGPAAQTLAHSLLASG